MELDDLWSRSRNWPRIRNRSQPATPRSRDQGPVIIKKYANRRLYNTDSSTYVTLETLAEMVRDQIEFLVVDAKNGEDLTRPTLTQIIVEQETKGAIGGMNLLPVPFLRQLIGMYGDSMQHLVPNYLEQIMQHFTASQQQWQELVAKNASQMQTFLPKPVADQIQAPIQAFQQAGQQAAQQMQQAMLKFFMPFASAPNASASDKTDTLNAMKQKVASLENELNGMNRD